MIATPGALPVKIMAISAGKGGVGKSNIAINLSIALAEKGNKVLLLDADLALANIDIMLGLNAPYNISHVLHGVCSLNDILLTGPAGIRIIPAASGSETMTNLGLKGLAGLVDAFNELTETFDYLIIDTAAGISESVLSFIRSAQELVIVMGNEPTSLTDAYALVKIMSTRYEWRHFHIVVNMVRDLREGREWFNKLFRASEQFLDVHLNYMGAIPFDEKVHEAVKLQQPVIQLYPNSAAAKTFQKLSHYVELWPFRQTIGGNTSFFIERLVLGQQPS